MSGQALVVQGDALHLPLPDASVDLVVTSPPYYSLRAYDAGPDQIGSEATPTEYLKALWAATAEIKRVLKPTGSAFINLGDKYSGAQAQNFNGLSRTDSAKVWAQTDPSMTGIPAKSLLLLPERYRIGCVDQTNPYYREQYTRELLYDLMDGEITPDQARAKLAAYDASPKSKGLGLIARSVIVWNKPNGLPESVTDRVRRSHEDWVHLVRQPRYYAAVDEIREPHSDVHAGKRGQGQIAWDNGPKSLHEVEGRRYYNVERREYNPLGKLPGSVWTIPSEPLRLPDHLGVDHYAAFPSEWPRRLVLGFSPPGVCVACGQGRWPVVERQYPNDRANKRPELRTGTDRQLLGHERPTLSDGPAEATILGYACACTPHTNHPGSGAIGHRDLLAAYGDRAKLSEQPRSGAWREYHIEGWQAPPTRSAVVCDPFGGTGTVAGVARQLGRIGISVDLSHAYGRAAKWRIFQSGDFGKAAGRTWKDRQGSLL